MSRERRNGSGDIDAKRHFAQIDEAVASGRLANDEWYERNRQLLETAYLETDDPQRQSGLNGDAAHWERRRRVVLEAIDRDGSFLDIGCANGLLMETIAGWARERGYRLEPYGVDISAKLAALARARLPQWADRVFVGNAITWEPPMRFDFVRTELVYVPSARQQELVARLIDRVVAPGGRLVVCAYRERGTTDAEPIGKLLNAWGCNVGGEAIATDATDGGVATRVVWLDSPLRS